MSVRFFTSRQKRQEYNWRQIDIWAFRPVSPWRVFPAYRLAGVFPTYGRQASSVPIIKENKAPGAIADIHLTLTLIDNQEVHIKTYSPPQRP